jgi:hypothetical protein
VATRRRGGADLDDLKARLGLAEEGDSPSADGDSDASADAEASSEEGEGDDSTEDSLSTSAAAAAAPAPRAAAAAPRPASPRAAAPAPVQAEATSAEEEDFASKESDEKFDVTFDPNAFDPSLKAPGRSVAGFVAVVSVVCIAVGVVVGLGLGLGNEKRSLVNSTIQSSNNVLARIEGVAERLTDLNARVQSLPVESTYNQEFEDTLAASYASEAPIFDGNSLVLAGSVLAYDARVTSPLLDYSMKTNLLASLVRSHLELTGLERDAIQTEIAGNADSSNYGIAFSLEGVLGAYNATLGENPAPYQPISAERVSFQTLEQVMIPPDASPDNQVAAYNVTNSAGAEIQVPIHDLLVLPRAQLLPAISDDTPLTRYRRRAARIKSLLNDVVVQQQDIVSGLREMGAQTPVFAF